MLKRTPFHAFHVSAGAKLVDFAGWEMPILYRGIVEEHHQTRNSGSLFDVSHMGRLYFTGPDAPAMINYVFTRDVSGQEIGQSRYGLICNEDGGVLDDVIVSRDELNWLVVCNAANREKLLGHFEQVKKDRGFTFDLYDQTEATAMVAVQGPKVIDRIAGALPVDVKSLKRYRFATATLMGVRFSIFRSGYTGEDGVELIIPATMAPLAVQMLAGQAGGENATIKPAGLGARDTLRLEAGMPLYGHELSERIDPLSAGLGWAVNLDTDFIGAERLREVDRAGPERRLVGLELQGRRIARERTPIRHGDAVVGEVTSGTFSPTLEKSVAMAYIHTDHAAPGTELAVELGRTLNPAKVVTLPFYKRQG